MGVIKSLFHKGTTKKKGVVFQRNDGKTVTLLNSSGKGAKYAAELRDKQHYTNDGRLKTNEDGTVKPLTNEEKAYRSGYLAANRDHADAYNFKNNKQAYDAAKAKRKEKFKKK